MTAPSSRWTTFGGTGRDLRAKLEAPEQAAYRLVLISRSDPTHVKSGRSSDTFETIRELPGPIDYDSTRASLVQGCPAPGRQLARPGR